jgi:hypothetical protein
MALFQVAVLISVIAINPTPGPGQIGAIYFDAGQESQVWIDLQPKSNEPGPDLVHLKFTVTFPGRELAHAPASLTLRAQTDCFAYPTRILQPILRVVLDQASTIDLTAPGYGFQFVRSCSRRSDAVVAQVLFALLDDISRARDVGVNALGFVLHLSAADLAGLQRFVELLRRGVAISKF